MVKTYILLIMSTLAIHTACGGGGSGKKIWNDAIGKQNKKAQDRAQWTEANLIGNWQINCQPSQFMQNTNYLIATLQIAQEGFFTYQGSEFSDQNCTDKIYEKESKGKVIVNDAVDSYRKSVQFSFSSGSGIVRSKEYVEVFNLIGVCGFKNWVWNQAQDLSNTVDCLDWPKPTLIGLSSDANGKNILQIFGKGESINDNTFIKK